MKDTTEQVQLRKFYQFCEDNEVCPFEVSMDLLEDEMSLYDF